MIEVQNLTKVFPRHRAVDDISFHVSPGEIVGFLGPNGAGKTTTLRMLTGFLPATKGAAAIGGYDVFRKPIEAKKKIGYMPENVPLYPDMRVKEYLKFRGKLKGLSGRKLKTNLEKSLEQCGLEHMRRRMIGNLSKGYRQRVGLADALIHEPELLILDEPTNGLDPNQIRSIRQLIRDLGQEHTILLSTHILSEVEMTCGKVIIIDGGRIKAADTPRNLVANMRSAGQVSLEVKATQEDVSKALQAISKIKKITCDPLDNGWNRFHLIVDSGTDTREKIAQITQTESWPLRALHRHEASLEDVFVELTRKD